MSINLGEILSSIPQDKLIEIMNTIGDITPEQLVEKLAAEGVSVPAEEASSLLTSLVATIDTDKEFTAEDLEAVAGGIEWEPGFCGWCLD